MKGSMDDLAGRVWTWLVQQEWPRFISEIMIGINHPNYSEVLEAVMFWLDCGEVATGRGCYSFQGHDFYVINAKDPGDDHNG